MRQRPPLTPVIAALPSTVPFVGPEAQERERGRAFRARIGANESSFGPSPKVIDAHGANCARHVDVLRPRQFRSEGGARRASSASRPGMSSSAKASTACSAWSRGCMSPPGDAVVTSLGAYPTFNFHVAGFGGRLVTVPYENDRESLDGLLAAARKEKAPLVYLSNPDNPMGTWWEAAELIRFIEALPETTMLVLDEAYGELGPASALPPIDISTAERHPDAHLLEGLWTGRHPLRLRGRRGRGDPRLREDPQPLSASAAWRRSPASRRLPTRTISRRSWRGSRPAAERIATIAGQTACRRSPRQPISSPSIAARDGAFALKVLQALLARDVFVRKPMVPVLDRCIRVSVGLDHELDIFAEELPGALAAARGN